MYSMLRALHPGYAGMEIDSFILIEIRVPPGVFTGVMYRARLAADRASKAAAIGKVDVQIQAFLLHRERHMIHQPRRNRSSRKRKPLFRNHPLTPVQGTTAPRHSTPYPLHLTKNPAYEAVFEPPSED